MGVDLGGGAQDHPAAESPELHFHVSHFSESLLHRKVISFPRPIREVGVVNVIPLLQMRTLKKQGE